MSANQNLNNLHAPVNGPLDQKHSTSSWPDTKPSVALYSPPYSLFFILLPSAPLCSSLDPCKWRVSASSVKVCLDCLNHLLWSSVPVFGEGGAEDGIPSWLPMDCGTRCIGKEPTVPFALFFSSLPRASHLGIWAPTPCTQFWSKQTLCKGKKKCICVYLFPRKVPRQLYWEPTMGGSC